MKFTKAAHATYEKLVEQPQSWRVYRIATSLDRPFVSAADVRAFSATPPEKPKVAPTET